METLFNTEHLAKIKNNCNSKRMLHGKEERRTIKVLGEKDIPTMFHHCPLKKKLGRNGSSPWNKNMEKKHFLGLSI